MKIKKCESDELFKSVLRINVILDVDSLLGDLMSHFDDKIVMKFIRLYSGKVLRLPSISEMWRIFRNKVVRFELDKEDAKERRVELADFFGISMSRISAILRKDREDYPDGMDINLPEGVEYIFRQELMLRGKHSKVKEIYSSEIER